MEILQILFPQKVFSFFSIALCFSAFDFFFRFLGKMMKNMGVFFRFLLFWLWKNPFSCYCILRENVV